MLCASSTRSLFKCTERLTQLRTTIADCKSESTPIVQQKLNSIKNLIELFEKQNLSQQTNLKSFNLKSQIEADYIDPSKLTIKEQLEHGTGGFGVVFSGLLDGKPVAIKKIDVKGTDAVNSFKKEVEMLSTLHHPNIIYPYGYTKFPMDKDQYCLVMELADNSLDNHLVKLKKIEDKIRIAYDIANGLAYLHKEEKVHGDIKSPNILMVGDTAKLADFGLSTTIANARKTSSSRRTTIRVGKSSSANQVLGSLLWQAPETIRLDPEKKIEPSSEPTTASDVYSFGAVFCELLSGKSPFDNLISERGSIGAEGTIRQAILGNLTDPKTGNILERGVDFQVIPEDKEIPVELKSLILECMNRNPKNRPSMKEVVLRLEKSFPELCKSKDKVVPIKEEKTPSKTLPSMNFGTLFYPIKDKSSALDLKQEQDQGYEFWDSIDKSPAIGSEQELDQRYAFWDHVDVAKKDISEPQSRAEVKSSEITRERKLG